MKLPIFLSLLLMILLLPSCGFDVNLAPQPLNIAICRPIEITMSKQTQEEIAQAVAQAISSQIPEIKKQLFAAPTSNSTKKNNGSQGGAPIIIVDVGDKSSNIPNSFHVPPSQFGNFDSQAQLLDKKTPILIFTPTHNAQIIKTVTDKLKQLGFTRVGTYSGNQEVLPSLT